MTEGGWDGPSGHTSGKRRLLKNRKEAGISGQEEACSRKGKKGERPSGRNKLGAGTECQPY